MTATGFVLAGAGANDASAGDVAWSNPGNITASDDVRAIAGGITRFQTTQYLQATNFGFDGGGLVPAGAQIDGIELKVERKRSSGTHHDFEVRLLKGGTPQGEDKADTATSWTNIDTQITYGGAADDWSTAQDPLTLSAADVRASNFGAAFRGTQVSHNGGKTEYVDAMWINVHYTAGGGGAGILPRLQAEGLFARAAA